LKGYSKTDLSASTPCLYESEELNTPITEDAGESSLANQKNLLSTLSYYYTAVLSDSDTLKTTFSILIINSDGSRFTGKVK